MSSKPWQKVHENLTRIDELGLFERTPILFEVLNSLKHVHLRNPAIDFTTQTLAKLKTLFNSTTLVLHAHDIDDSDLLQEALESLSFFLKEPIKIETYNSGWPQKYEQEAQRLRAIFGKHLLEIHHFGSTSVPGLDAKPIIDIIVVLPKAELADTHASELIQLGYEPRGSYVHAKHRFFNKSDFHLHVFEPRDPEIAHNLRFRDHLSRHPADRDYYSRIKHMTVEQNSLDAQNYRDAKDLFVKLTKYNPADSQELAYKERMLELLKNTPNCFERSSLKAHFTASAWLLNKTGDKALLMHHRKLDRWLQLGGHADGDRNLLRVATKEAQEESGIDHIVAVDSNIFDIDIHALPDNHEHFDVRFLLQVTSDEDAVQNHESKELRWIGKNPEELPVDNKSVRRMFDKWLLRKPWENNCED